MVSCDNWTSSAVVPDHPAFVQGDYLLKLVGSGGQEGYVPLTVSDPASTAAYLVINRTFTEEGWNTYGGYSFYQGQGPCPPGSGTYPVCNRARVVSFDRPYNTGNGASDFLGNEFPLVQFCEEHGLDVSYVTDVDLDATPPWPCTTRPSCRSATTRPGRTTSAWRPNRPRTRGPTSCSSVRPPCSATCACSPRRWGPTARRSTTATPRRTRWTAGNPLQVTGNTWSSPPTSWSEIPFVGELYSGYLDGTDSAPFVVYDAAAWLFAGTGLQNGRSSPGVIESDVDHLARRPRRRRTSRSSGTRRSPGRHLHEPGHVVGAARTPT